MHKIRVFIPEVIYGARNGLLMVLFMPGSVRKGYLFYASGIKRGRDFTS